MSGGPRDGDGGVKRRRRSICSFFTEDAESWESRYEGPETPESHDYRARGNVALEWLGRPGDRGPGTRRLLELGCGAGVQAREAAELGWRVMGVDLSLEMLRRARDGGGVSVLGAGAERLPFRAEFFDVVVALGLIGYVPDPAAALREIRAVLRPGGRLIISFYADPPYLLDRVSRAVSWLPDRVYLGLKDLLVGHEPESSSDPGFYRRHNRPFPPEEFFGLLETAGFRRVRWQAINFGRLRFMDRRVLPDRVEVALARWLERLTSLPGLGGLRHRARTHVVAAVAPAP